MHDIYTFWLLFLSMEKYTSIKQTYNYMFTSQRKNQSNVSEPTPDKWERVLRKSKHLSLSLLTPVIFSYGYGSLKSKYFHEYS